MELRHLRYFIAVAEELHFGRAARRLNITQPPLSYNIQQLEERLGVQLLVRDSRNVDLTPAGQAFLAEARRVIDQANRAADTARIVDHGQLGNLQLGFTSSMLYRGMPEILKDFSDTYPNVGTELMDMPIVNQFEAIRQGRLHGGFVPALALETHLTGLQLADDAYACCVNEAHWAAHHGTISLSQLANETFILFGHENTVSGHEYVLSMCVRAGFHPKVGGYVRQWLTGLALVAQNIGIALMPASLESVHFPGVKFVRLDEINPVSAFFVWNPAHMPPTLKIMVARMHELIRQVRSPDLTTMVA